MLTAIEFDQVITAIVKMSISGLNYEPQVATQHVLELLSTFTETRPKVETHYDAEQKRYVTSHQHAVSR